ncbi:Uncharacterized protein Rs2_22037 [Raphanus sativus]|uniref:Uncharacterized protein LOC108863167 n=1 Tax=Raphanus sativus TaxID=3726 RepID=A0A9W3DT59_RAPSA|nr:uncharacterized protein LOC108863167 [Raphanus sativus]KAJ4895243.1 Uncharacterized protein Rs2_22037 [Raphanus sativus]
MGCFLGCFGGRKNRRRQKRRESSDQARANNLSVEYAKPVHLNDRRVSTTVEEIPKSSVIPITTDICDEEAEEKSSPSPNSRKRVTFDSNVKTHEHIIESQESAQLLQEKKEEVIPDKAAVQSSSENSVVASNPSGDRYKNCRESDDEIEEDELLYCGGESDLDDEFYSDEAFSEEHKLHTQTKEDAKLRMSNESVQGVLNPVENLTQWKSAKSNGKTVHKQSQKENSNNLISDQEDRKKDSFSFGADSQTDDTTLSFKQDSKKVENKEVTVDASLSTWLSASETGSECNSVSNTPEKNKSTSYLKRVINSHDDRPVLCALTSEDIKQFSAASTPRKSPRKSPDETPIIGTVGGYWGNHSKAVDCGSASSFKGIPNTTSKYREDRSVNWHSTPFEARLEKALNRDK